MLRGLATPFLMFDFSSPESSLQMLNDATRSSGDGPGVPELPVDEQTEEELRRSLAYTFMVATTAMREYNEDVQKLAVAAFNEVWVVLIDSNPGFRERFLAGKTQVPGPSKKPYMDYLQGATSEL